MTAVLLSTSDLQKSFSGERPFTLGPLSLSLQKGDSVAMLGANGAGKSTLFQLLTGNLAATSGRIHLDSLPISVESSELKRRFGYLPQSLDLPKWATARELLTFGCALYRCEQAPERIAAALEEWDISSFQNLPLAACSYGMQKRVGLALAFIHDPDVAIIDEPFSGLDLFHIKALENKLLRRQRGQGITILSTHVAPYAARFCDRAFIIQAGHIEELTTWGRASHAEREQQVLNAFFTSAS